MQPDLQPPRTDHSHEAQPARQDTPATGNTLRQANSATTALCPPLSFIPFEATGQIIEELFPAAREAILREAGEWCLQTSRLAPAGTPGWRDLNWSHEHNCPLWCYPWSNAGDRIEALLHLHRALGTAEPLQVARRYADSIISNTAKGICQDGGDGDGMAWYWRESQTLMTNYTMRLPVGLLALARETGEEKYRDAALLCGEALLAMQSESGMFYEGMIPADLPPAQREEAQKWVTRTKINSRVGYAFYPLALLALETGETRWLDALHSFATAFLAHQRTNGSFAEDIAVTPADPAPAASAAKGHFHTYILYGMVRALQLLGGSAPAGLHSAALRLADYMTDEIAMSGSHFYGNSREDSPAEAHMWLTARGEAAAGLAAIADYSGQNRYRRAAQYLVIQSAMQQATGDTPPHMRGGIVEWRRTGDSIRPTIDGFANFWVLLACTTLA